MLDFDNIHVPNPMLHKFYPDSEPKWELTELRDHRIECGCGLQEAITHMGPRYDRPDYDELFNAYVALSEKFNHAVRVYHNDIDEMRVALQQTRDSYIEMRDKYDELRDTVDGFPPRKCPTCGKRMRHIKAYTKTGQFVSGQIHVLDGEPYICTEYDCYTPSMDDDDWED